MYAATTIIFASSLNKISRFHGAIALYCYKSQGMSKCAKNISDTLNSTLLVLRIQLVKHSTIVDSAVVFLAFSPLCFCCSDLLFCFVLIIENWNKLSYISCAIFLFLPYSDIACDLLLNR